MLLKSAALRGPLGLAFAACVLTAAFLNFEACAGGQSRVGAPEGAGQAATPARVTAEGLARLRWIEGAWRGTGDVEKPFYERYHFEGDSTLVVESLADETLSKVEDVTRFEVKDGQFGNGGEGPRWVASELTDDAITFAPARGARNSFRWQREADGSWKAVLDWPAAEGKPARRRVYRMERWPPLKQ
jgi:hypothetical protein